METRNDAERNQMETAERIDDAQKTLAARLVLDEREMRLIKNCKVYELNDPAGLPGHNLAIIIAKMAGVLGI